MTTIGTTSRMNRIGSDGRILNVPMDHGITLGPTQGLQNIEETIEAVTQNGADSILTQKGLAERVHPHKHGKGYFIHLNGSTTLGPDSNDKRRTGRVKEAIRLGADAVSFHINIGSDYEPNQIEELATITKQAHEYGMPVLAMTYARGPDIDEYDADTLAHAVRVGEEIGADLVKTAYSGDTESYAKVAKAVSIPLLMAGGKPQSDREMLQNVSDAIEAGAAGVSMGRSIFQHESPGAMTAAVSAIVHENASVDEAMRHI
ncbi:MAG: 2-amino-3,7-dideoxy-D-threo-hept-6-ulosonate synthase [Halobacteriaceae archaeon]